MANAGQLVREARKRHGLTQEQLAARARTSQAAISRIERGVVSPTVDTLATLLDLMGEELVLDAMPIDFELSVNPHLLALTPDERLRHGTRVANIILRHARSAGEARELETG